jgi:uncharacterized protein
MIEISDYLLLFLLGALGSFIAGLLGVGGGIVFIPILDYFLRKIGLTDEVLVKGILANSLFVILFSGLVASYKQYRIGNFYLREILQTAIPGMVSSAVITYLIKTGNWYSKQAFNYVFASMLVIIALRMLLVKSTNKGNANSDGSANKNGFYITGFLSGIITAFSGLGGGVVMTPVFTEIMKLNIKRASSISNGVIPCMAIIIGVLNLTSSAPQFFTGYQQIGFIFMPIVLPMILATFIFAPLGVTFSQRIKPEWIRLIFGSFVLLVFIKLLYEIFSY